AREVVRVTKGKGIIVSGGVTREAEYRGPKDVQNLITLLGLAQNLAHDVSAITPRSLILRAHKTRKTYHIILSEPKLVVPTVPRVPTPQDPDRASPAQHGTEITPATASLPARPTVSTETPQQSNHSNKKRPHAGHGFEDGTSRKKKKKKDVELSK
ncbi:hypothetical protein PAXINDRAFT_91300, partial [Paxillus involutus ATCC 200175]